MGRASRCRDRRVVTLRRDGHALHVEPAPPEVIDALRTGVHVAAASPAYGYEVGLVPLPLYEQDRSGRGDGVRCNAALEPAVRLALASAGYEVREEGVAPPSWPAADAGRLAPLGRTDTPLLDLVRCHARGLVLIDPDTIDPALLVAQVALAWPDKTVAVAATRDGDVRELRDRLRKYGLDVTAVTGDDAPARVGRVVVGTYLGLGHTPARLHRRDVLVALDAAEAVGERGCLCLSHAGKARLIGLLDVHARPSPFQRDQMLTFFGFEQLSIPRHGHLERDVRVVRVRYAGGMPLGEGLGVVPLNRRGLWHHERRNRLVAKIAAAFAGGDRHLQQELAPGIGALPTTCDTIVLVENVEHGLALAEKMPGWPLATGPDVCLGGLEQRQVESLERVRSRGASPDAGVIVTATALRSLDLNGVDVVVRADAGVGLPPLPAHRLVVPNERPGQPLLIVDLDDRHHALLRKWGRARAESYEERGWLAPGADATSARVERFLKGRLGVKR